MSLVIIPLPYKDESFRGYILRTAEANLLPDSKVLFRLVGLQKYNKFENLLIPDKEMDFSKARILLNNENIKDMVLINQLGYEEVNQYEGIKFHLWRYATCAHKQRICTLCISEAQYHRDIWELSLVITCPIHNCLLIDKCQACGSRINPYRQSLLQCKCGFDYRTSEVEFNESYLSTYLYKRFYNDQRLPQNFSMMNELSLCSFIYLINVASRWVNGTMNKRSVTNLSESIAESNLKYIVEKSFSIFRDWPINFFEFIDDFRLNDQSNDRNLASYGRFRSLIKGNLDYPQFEFIHKSLNSYLLNFFNTGYTRQIHVNDISFRRNFKKLHASTIRQHKTAFTDAITRKAAAEMLGVGLDQIDNFVSKNIIKPIHGPEVDGNPYVLFNRDELSSLIEVIGKKVESETGPLKLITFYEAAKFASLFDKMMSDFLIELIKGELRPSAIREGTGLNRFYFEVNRLEEYFIGEFLTIKMISSKLKIKRASVERWVKLGYLKVSKTYKSGKHQLISSDDFVKFRKSYIPAVEIVRAHKTISSTEKLLAELSIIGVSPVNIKIVGTDLFLLRVNNELIRYMDIMCSSKVIKKRHPPLDCYYYIK